MRACTTKEKAKITARAVAVKSRPKAAFRFQPDVLDQTVTNAGFDFRRYAMKPSPAKSRIIIAQVVGSGTAAEMVTVAGPLTIPVRWKVPELGRGATVRDEGPLGSRRRVSGLFSWGN
jgi:hypothetical protein